MVSSRYSCQLLSSDKRSHRYWKRLLEEGRKERERESERESQTEINSRVKDKKKNTCTKTLKPQFKLFRMFLSVSFINKGIFKELSYQRSDDAM